MVSVGELRAFLTQRPEYVKTFKKAIEHERANSNNPNYLGWEWYDVETLGAKLQRLVVNGFVKVNFHSRSSTCYRVNNLNEVLDALESFLPSDEYRRLQDGSWFHEKKSKK
jgi:hypothetical protein